MWHDKLRRGSGVVDERMGGGGGGKRVAVRRAVWRWHIIYTQMNALVEQEREWSAPYVAEEREWSGR